MRKTGDFPTFVFVGVLILNCLSYVISYASGNRYKDGEPVPLPQSQVILSFRVSIDIVTEKKEALGEVLNGDRLVSAPYKLNFKEEKDSSVVCKKKLSKDEVAYFRKAVDKDCCFQMNYDDLPIWGFIGKVDSEGKTDPSEYKYFLFKHIQFDVLYNKDRVIEVNARMDPHSLVDLTEDKEVDAEFMYSVKWKETDTAFDKRMDKYSMSSSLPHHLEIHWFSIINSCVTVLLLTGFLATILMRVLKNDFIKYGKDEEAADDKEETGWKYIHGDVFRFPKYKLYLLLVLDLEHSYLLCKDPIYLFLIICMIIRSVFIFMLALVGVFYPYNRGALFTALVVIYALTSGIAGYTSTSFYCQLEGNNWVVTSPLLVLGGIAGKNSKVKFQAPCRTIKYPREIPPLPWYRNAIPHMAMAGFLPFSAIYIELYYIFAGIWGHRIYTIYSILFIVFIILLIVTAFITVALAYFQLAAEDHECWWRYISYLILHSHLCFFSALHLANVILSF
ncbi:Transmembrane 9 superfamily member 3 [Hibiscus syriacus]|uniref:Transmembrane 9 superfamily member n=1 Tax=Hibiscus syriacus TaxID=106335 RepID=A0A6A2YRK5_HIBSY|nr:Transmembrane 9 superfamily member 3 [Hibiscus syriacus]